MACFTVTKNIICFSVIFGSQKCSLRCLSLCFPVLCLFRILVFENTDYTCIQRSYLRIVIKVGMLQLQQYITHFSVTFSVAMQVLKLRAGSSENRWVVSFSQRILILLEFLPWTSRRVKQESPEITIFRHVMPFWRNLIAIPKRR